MKTALHNFKKILLLVAVNLLAGLAVYAQTTPELVFKNPVLVSGTANKQGAVYRFANVSSGIDAEVTLRKFSTSRIVMQAVDNPYAGWEKALQPSFGIEGTVAARQNWFIDFELKFFEAKSKKKKKIDKIELTALDIDGDDGTLREYTVFEKAAKTTYSTFTHLQGSTVGEIGHVFTCGECGKLGKLYTCSNCKGTGLNGGGDDDDDEDQNIDDNCKGSGKLHEGCSHAYVGPSGTLSTGSNIDYAAIDTSATQLMVMYTYEKVDNIRFRYGASTGSRSSVGKGMRLYSVWFRQFSLRPIATLPVQVSAFSATRGTAGVLLQWTGNEENFSHYTVQRSTDGTHYSDIAVVMAGNEKRMNSYTFVDKTVPSGAQKLHYRLKLVDNTREFSFTGARTVTLSGAQQVLSLQTYPNPAAGYVNLVLPQQWQNDAVQIQVHNFNGVLVRAMPAQKGAAIHGIDLGGLAKGQYIITARTEAALLEQKIMKQ